MDSLAPEDLISLIVLAALWGASFLFIRIAAPLLGPAVLMDLRVLLAAAALVLYSAAVKRLPNLKTRWRSYLVLGGLNAAIPFTLIAFAELHLPASVAAILNATTPLFSALVAVFWLHDKLTRTQTFGLLLGVIGVGVLVGGGSFVLTPGLLVAVAASLLAACLYAIGGVYSKAAFHCVSPLNLAIGQQLGAGLLLLPAAGLTSPHHRITPQVAFAVLALSLLCTAVAYLLYFRLIARVGPTQTLTVTFLVPVFGVLWGVLLLHEPLMLSWIIGLTVILISMWLVTGAILPSRWRLN
jgi:drug/metabolite transporter (DMT)-like permease